MYVRFGKQFYRRTYIRFNDNTFYGKRADWNTTPFVKLWLNATIASYRYEFGKNQWKYSVKINWLDRVYNKKYCMFHYCKFCVTHINKIYDKLMDIYVCAFFWDLVVKNLPAHHCPAAFKYPKTPLYALFYKRLVCPYLPISNPLSPWASPPFSLFPFYRTSTFQNLDLCFIFELRLFISVFFASPFKISPQLYLITSQLSFSFILSNIQHPRVFFFPDHSFYGICFNACNHFSWFSEYIHDCVLDF